MNTTSNKKSRPGFTLIELVVTIAILSVVAVIVIPTVRTLSKDRKVRDTARIVGTAFAAARERAAVDGSAGVEIVPLANATGGYNVPNMGMAIYQLRAIPPYLGDVANATATITMIAGMTGTATIPGTSDLSATGANVRVDDYIEFNHSGVLYRITNVMAGTPSTITFAIGAHDPNPPEGVALPFKIYRQPVRVESGVVRLPNNLFVDLALSGHGNDGSQFGLTGALQIDPGMPGYNVPVRVWFNRDGSVDRVFDRDAAVMVSPNGPLFFLMAVGEGDIDVTALGTQRFIEDDDNLWITVDHRNGSVSIGRMAELGAALTLAEKLTAAGPGPQPAIGYSLMTISLPRPSVFSLQQVMKNHLSTRRFRPRPVRRGISLFEVLISILVAAIGVFGVLVLIPFAARTAQLGIDRESAINAAKNYFADFQAYGYHDPETWIDNLDYLDAQERNRQVDRIEPMGVPPMVLPLVPQPWPPQTTTNNNNIALGWPYLIDPLGSLTNLGNPAVMQYGQFPQSTAAFPLPNNLPTINLANTLDPDSPNMPGLRFGNGFGLARRLSLQPDDLRFLPPADELGPPRQVYYSMDAIPEAKRQYDGRYTTIAFVIPEDDQGRQYRMITIVGKAGDRVAERVFEVIDPGAAPAMPPDMMRIVKTDTAPLTTREYEQVAIGGGDLLLSEIPTAGQPALDEDQIRNNDWIMLISYYRTDPLPYTPGPPPTGEPTFDDIQLDFHRVIHADRVSPDADADPMPIPAQGIDRGAVTGAERTYSVTLQGSDFDLYRDWEGRMVNDRTDVSTYAILIPNVLAVYERSFRVEPDSTWAADP